LQQADVTELIEAMRTNDQ